MTNGLFILIIYYSDEHSYFKELDLSKKRTNFNIV